LARRRGQTSLIGMTKPSGAHQFVPPARNAEAAPAPARFAAPGGAAHAHAVRLRARRARAARLRAAVLRCVPAPVDILGPAD
jgi:hypothetical protein